MLRAFDAVYRLDVLRRPARAPGPMASDRLKRANADLALRSIQDCEATSTRLSRG